MPRAAGPFKIIEKINDNAYKLELPPKFGVSLSFNIADLKSYLEEEDELASRTTLLQKREDDENIIPLDTNNTRYIDMQGSITGARACCLNQEVSLFHLVIMRMICYLMILLYLEIIERIMKYLEEDLEEENIRRGVQVKREAHNIPSSSLPRSSGAAWTRTDAQVTYGVQIRRSTYVWKAKLSNATSPMSFESIEIVEISGHPEPIRVLQCRLLGR
jgi:hypothetical protein